MVNKLTEILNNTCSNWEQWINSFDNFVGHKPRDSNNKISMYKDYPDYCIWQQNDENIYTISYKYVNHINLYGDMHCLQQYSLDKMNALINYQKIYNVCDSNVLPALNKFEIKDHYIFTHFKSSYNNVGFPAPYNLFKIMMYSDNVIDDFNFYITTIVDNYFSLWKTCKELNLPFYKPSHLLINHFCDDNVWYFKDSTFFHTENISVEEIANSWFYTIDGFKRAQGIIDAYSNRPDSDLEIRNKIFEEINVLKNYARNKCLSLQNVNQL